MNGDVIERFASKSSSAVYEVVVGDGGGVAWCRVQGTGVACPGWKFSKRQPKSCKHVEELVKRGTLDADYRIAASQKGNAGQVNVRAETAPAPRTLESVRAETPVIKKGAPEAMLAHQVEKAPCEPWGREDWTMELKLDGFRLFVIGGEARNVQYSRLANLHDHDFLTHLPLPAGTILDGEMCAASDKSVYAQGKRGDDRYVVFDVLQLGEHDLRTQPWNARREAVEMLVGKLGEPRVETSTVFGRPNRTMAEDLMASGHEGVMLKRTASTYQEGRRSWDWLKVKATATYDVVIVDAEGECTSVERKAAGWRGLRYGWMVNGVLTVAGSLGVTGPPEELAPHIGKVAVVKAYSIGRSGALRHPGLVRYRSDKAPADCRLEDVV